MPYMKINTTRKLSHAQRSEIAEGLNQAMTIIPGKSAAGVVVYFDEGKTFFLGGSEVEDCAFVETDICGKFPFQVKYDFTVASFNALKKVLNMDDSKISMKIQEHMSWGNFGDFIETDEMGRPTTK